MAKEKERKATRDAEGSIIKAVVPRSTSSGRTRNVTVYYARVRINEYDDEGNFVKQHSRKRTEYSYQDAVDARREIRAELEAEIANAKYAAPKKTVRRFFDLLDYFRSEYVKEALYAGEKKISGQKDPIRNTDRMLDNFRKYFEHNPPLVSIDYASLFEYKKAMLLKPYKVSVRVKLAEGESWSGKIYQRHRQRFKVVDEWHIRKPATVHRYLSKLRRIFSVGVQQGFLATNPFRQGDPLIVTSIEETRERICTHEEERRLLDTCSGPRAHLADVIICAIDTFVRENELFSLVGSDIHLDDKYLIVRERNSKTQKPRTVPLSDRVVQAFERLRRDRSETDWNENPVFPFRSVNTAWYTALEKTGIEDLRFHDLRGTGITRMLEANVPAPIVMQFSGHKKFETFKKYVKKDLRIIQNAAEAISSLNRLREMELARAQGTLATNTGTTAGATPEIHIEGEQ